MNRQAKTDAEQLFMSALEQNSERLAKVAQRLSLDDLIEIGARSFWLFETIQDALSPNNRLRLGNKIQEIREITQQKTDRAVETVYKKEDEGVS